jgi:serine/threonine protein kinase
MSEVYRARDTQLGRDVAIKVISAHLTSNPDLGQRLDHEAKAISSLNQLAGGVDEVALLSGPR